MVNVTGKPLTRQKSSANREVMESIGLCRANTYFTVSIELGKMVTIGLLQMSVRVLLR